jgi:hypothetical protein
MFCYAEREITGCAWCGRIRRSDGRWEAPRGRRTPRWRRDTLTLRPTTHGICPECYERERAKMRAQLAEQAPA